MKTKTILITLIAILAIAALVFQSCKKEDDNDEQVNKLPTCQMTAPVNNQEIVKGETVLISVEANDNDGTITEVSFFIDGVEKGSIGSSPYNYSWTTNNESIGNHTLKATSTDNSGAHTSDEIIITIVESSGNIPIANFIADITSGTAPLSINFTDQSENNPTSWQWDFGDGGSSTQSNPSYTYNAEGSYTVILIATNSIGADQETKTHYILVSGSGINTPPTALFTVYPTSGTTSTHFGFGASGCTDNEDLTSDLQVRWDFDGDGSWDTDWDHNKIIQHQYDNEAIYTAKLEVKDTEGLTDQYTNNITVSNGGGTGTFTDPRDGQVYNIVDIGSQTWFAENLNYETTDSWWYDNSSANGDIYGRLYTWEAALTACPTGWHLPSDDEWKIMEIGLGMSSSEASSAGWRGTDEGKKMKSTSGWFNNGNGTNSSGFDALPGGYFISGTFSRVGEQGFWWSTKTTMASAWKRSLSYDYDQVNRYYLDQTSGFSVRCIKD